MVTAGLFHDFRPACQEADGYHGGDGEAAAYLLVAQVQEGQVEDNQEHADAEAGEGLGHDGETHYAAVDDFIGDEEDFQSHGGDEGAYEDGEVFF